MIQGVDSVLEVMQKMANEYIDKEPSKFINAVTNSYRDILEAVAKGKTNNNDLTYGEKNGHKVVPSLNKSKKQKNIDEGAFFNGGLTNFDNELDK